MKRLLLLTTLIGVLFAVPDSFAQTSKPKRATIKYKDGRKYVGKIRKEKTAFGTIKRKHGNGIMYFVNGDQLNGIWYNNECGFGTYKLANGDIFEGKIYNSKMLQDGSMCFSSDRGKITFASEGTIELGHQTWHYPANCSFTGTIKDKKPSTGSFDCTLTTKNGDCFTGKLSYGHLGYGKIEYANGNTFERKFPIRHPVKRQISLRKHHGNNKSESQMENSSRMRIRGQYRNIYENCRYGNHQCGRGQVRRKTQ